MHTTFPPAPKRQRRSAPRALLCWIIAATVALLLSTSYLLDGPNDIETAQAVADDLRDAQAVRK